MIHTPSLVYYMQVAVQCEPHPVLVCLLHTPQGTGLHQSVSKTLPARRSEVYAQPFQGELWIRVVR